MTDGRGYDLNADIYLDTRGYNQGTIAENVGITRETCLTPERYASAPITRLPNRP